MNWDLSHLRERTTRGGNCIYSGSTGRFFKASEDFKARLRSNHLTHQDTNWLEQEGHLAANDLGRHANAFARAQRRARPGPLQYLILIPTLRCNLSCSYCQVSRADENASGFDWSDETLDAVIRCVSQLSVPNPKIEFQGGEPSLRPDLINAVMEAVPSTISPTFVICTNLQSLSAKFLEIVQRPDVQISTSLDGDFSTHARQRQGADGATQAFMDVDFR